MPLSRIVIALLAVAGLSAVAYAVSSSSSSQHQAKTMAYGGPPTYHDDGGSLKMTPGQGGAPGAVPSGSQPVQRGGGLQRGAQEKASGKAPQSEQTGGLQSGAGSLPAAPERKPTRAISNPGQPPTDSKELSR